MTDLGPRWPLMRAGLSSRIPSLPEFVLAVLLAGVLSVGTILAATLQVGRSRPLDLAAFLLVALAAVVTVGLRRTFPLWALGASMTVVGAYLLVGYPYGPVQLCMIITMFEVARRCSPRVSALACALAAVVAAGTVAIRVAGESGHPLLIAAAWMGWVVLPWSLGALVHAVTAARERFRHELVTRVALEERMKMAGEVHDVAGHGFSVVAMQAGVALLVFDEEPEQARMSLEAIQATSVKSLTELRTMLDAFHPEGPSHPAGAPVVPGDDLRPDTLDPVLGEPGLDGLTELVEQVRAGGLPVDLDMDDVGVPLSDDIDVVAYRVVQESLTNVLRHAGPTTADVRIARHDDELVVQIVDGGCGTPHEALRQGRGLIGMRRRVEDVGGRIDAAPREGGGFRVAAHLPLPVGPE